jgi:hypothetical protein
MAEKNEDQKELPGKYFLCEDRMKPLKAALYLIKQI